MVFLLHRLCCVDKDISSNISCYFFMFSRAKSPVEKFSPPLEKCVGCNLKILDIVQKNWAPFRKLFAPLGVPSWSRAWCSVGYLSAISSSLVYRRAYRNYILAIEVKNSARVMLPSFNTIAVFLNDVMVSENDVLEAGKLVCYTGPSYLIF